jgi:DNA-binding transcriptional LysR family regulator
LEQRLGGTILLSRTTRRVHATETGLRYADQAREALRQLQAAEGAVTEQVGLPRGLVRISLPPAIGKLLLLGSLAKLSREYEGPKIDIDLSDRYVDLFENRTDIAVRLRSTEQSGIVEQEVSCSPLIAVAAPAYLAGRQWPQTAQDLLDHQFVMPNTRLGGPSTNRISRLLGVNLAQLTPIRIKDIGSMIELLLQGYGIGFIPRILVESMLRTGELTALPLDIALPAVQFFVVCRHEHRALPRIQLVVNNLKKALQCD